MKASHTREAVAIALNMAYMFSSERFKTALYEFGPLHSNNDKTEIDKTALLANVLNHRGLTFGYTTGVMGLGGGTTFGMHEVCYPNTMPMTKASPKPYSTSLPTVWATAMRET